MTANNKARAAGTATGQVTDNNMGKDTPQIPIITGPLNEPEGSFPGAVFENLPDLLYQPCQLLTDHNEREVFLIGALAIISGILPNVRGFYDNQFYSPHLFVFIVAPHGSGKGSLKLAYRLGNAVHKMIKERSVQEIADWKAECLEAVQAKQEPPPHPGNKMLFVPANNSKSGIIELLTENDGKGILFETEGDTLTDAIKTDHGNFSDLLRKAYHHEKISFYRRTDKELKEIEHPSLAVLLSATFDQYTRLIPTPANGLFSRFAHFCPEPNTEFRNVFDTQRQTFPQRFDAFGDSFEEIYTVLEGLTQPIEYSLQAHQEKRFLETFGAWKKDFCEYVSPDMEGTSHRLALMAYRISMILTAVRNFGEGDFSEKMYCTDTDFETSFQIIETLKSHALEVFRRLPKPAESREYLELKNELSEKAERVAQARYLATQDKGPSEIARIIFGDESKRNTVFYWLNRKK